MKLSQILQVLLGMLACTATQAKEPAVPLIGGSLNSLSVFASTYVTTGANSVVIGDILAGDVFTAGAGSFVDGNIGDSGAASLSSRSPMNVTPVDVRSAAQQLGAAQGALRQMGQGVALATTMTIDTTLYAGVFSAANLSTTAGITLTLDGQNQANPYWVFNIDDYLVTGASMKMVLINADDSARVIWNSGGYASLGASDAFIGTILAKDYVSVGAATTVAGLGSSCGGVFSTTSYVSTGAGARIGGSGCSGIGSGFDIVGGVSVRGNTIPSIPEPASYWMLLFGLAVIGLKRPPRKTAIFS